MVSTVILSYNRCSEILITINLLKQLRPTLPFKMQIVVVDNASIDNTSGQIMLLHPDVTLIQKNLNNGIEGWNDGFEQARGNYFLVLDDDSHIESGLTGAIAYMNDNPEIGILALNISGGTYQTDDIEEWADKEDCIAFIGCGAIIKKELYEKIGGFADWLYLYTHEYEYGIRCWAAGYKIKFFKNSCVVHRTSNLNRTNKRLRTFSTRNELAIIYKYFYNKRPKYLFRVFINNLKLIKTEGLSAGFYVISGGYMFIKMRKTLSYTPVSKEVQNFFVKKFKSTYPIFFRLNKKLVLGLKNRGESE